MISATSLIAQDPAKRNQPRYQRRCLLGKVPASEVKKMYKNEVISQDAKDIC